MHDVQSRPRLASLLLSSLCLVSGLSVPACSGLMHQLSDSSAVESEQDTIKANERKEVLAEQRTLKKALKQQTGVNQELEERLIRLQLELLEKEAQLNDLSGRLEEAILEVVRAKAKLRSLGSKAEAASNLAEAEIAMKALEARTSKGARTPQSARADELLKLGAKEFKKENYSGALYLSSQAKSLIRESQERSTSWEQLPLLRGEVAFALPVPLQTRSAGSLRVGPGRKFKAIAKMEAGAQILGHSYRGRWVRVRAGEGMTGWVPYTLINGR